MSANLSVRREPSQVRTSYHIEISYLGHVRVLLEHIFALYNKSECNSVIYPRNELELDQNSLEVY